MPKKKPTETLGTSSGGILSQHEARATVRAVPPPETPPPVTSTVIPPPAPWHFLSLDEWRASPHRVVWLRELMTTASFRELLGMLHNQARVRPRNMPLTQDAIALEFGRGEGRADVLSWIEQAAVPLDAAPDIPVNYGVPDVPEEPLAD